jgi:hypothetical protein
MNQLNHREILEAQTEFLRGPGFNRFFKQGFGKEVQRMKSELLTNESLDEPVRKAYIIALRMIKQGIVNSYEEHKFPVPEWVEKELL